MLWEGEGCGRAGVPSTTSSREVRAGREAAAPLRDTGRLWLGSTTTDDERELDRSLKEKEVRCLGRGRS